MFISYVRKILRRRRSRCRILVFMFGWQPHLIEIYKSMHGNMAITVFFSLKIGFYAIKASTLLIGTFFTNNTNTTFRRNTGLRCHCQGLSV